MRKAHLYDSSTKVYLYDWIKVSPNEKGEYVLPENATWTEPKKSENEYFILAKWNPEANEWEEGGENPIPAPPVANQTDMLVKQNVMLQRQLLDIENQLQKLTSL